MTLESDISCFFCRSLLSDHMDRLLPHDREDAITRHLKNCSECEMFFYQFKKTVAAVQQFPVGGIPKDVAELILSASNIEHGFHTHKIMRFFRESRRPLSAIVLGVVAIASTFLTYGLNHPEKYPWLSLTTLKQYLQFDDPLIPYEIRIEDFSALIEEQTAWLLAKPSLSANLWEEGGLSPETLETMFEYGNDPLTEHPNVKKVAPPSPEPSERPPLSSSPPSESPEH